jgi:hypothetical protein
MTLGELIKWFEKQDPNLVVKDGFGPPHSDYGYYDHIAFDPLPKTKINDMIEFAKSAIGKEFISGKGGIKFKVDEYTSVYIGKDNEMGEEVTPLHFKYWILSEK